MAPDSGAGSHMSFSREDFHEYRQLRAPLTICVANGDHLKALGTGSVRVLLANGNTVTLMDVLHVPLLDRKLLSIPALVAKGVSVKFEQSQCSISFSGKSVVEVPKRGKLYAMEAILSPSEVAAAASLHSWDTWHARLGHVAPSKLPAVARAVQGIPAITPPATDSEPCEGCACGKMSATKYSKQSGSTIKSQAVLDIVHSDVIGPLTPKSMAGAQYVLVFVDDYSRYVHTYLLKSKSEVADRFREYKELVECQTSRKIKCIRSDNGTEYVNKRVKSICSSSGIVLQTTVPYSPQQNGLAERKNRTIIEMARAMIYHQHLEKYWWGEAVMTAVYLTNRIPNSVRHDTTPSEVFTGVKPRLDHLRVFGSRGYDFVDKTKRTKWDAKASKCIFLGYADASKGCRVWDIENQKIVISRTVHLDENAPSRFRESPSHHDQCIHLPTSGDVQGMTVQPPAKESDQVEDMDVDEGFDDGTHPMDIDDMSISADTPSFSGAHDFNGSTSLTRHVRLDQGPADYALNLGSRAHEHQQRGSSTLPVLPSAQSSSPTVAQALAGPLEEGENQIVFHQDTTHMRKGENELAALPSRASNRLALPPSGRDENRLVFRGQARNEIANARVHPALPASSTVSERSIVTSRAQLRTLGDQLRSHPQLPSLPAPEHSSTDTHVSDTPIANNREPTNKRPRSEEEFEIALVARDVPQSYTEAIESPDADKWREPMLAKIRSHVRNYTWDLIRRPPGAKVIGCKWVFAIKRNEHGEITRYKARLVALGFLQTLGIDYHETYSPVASMNTIRVFLAICCKLGLFIKQFDIETAFLNGDLEEIVLMYPPRGLKTSPGMVCRLRRSLYGLKQAAAVWFKKIKSVFIDMGFVQCVADPCLFSRDGKHGPVLIALYVNDLLVGCKAASEALRVKATLAEHFTVKALGDARFLLGMEITYDRAQGLLDIRHLQCIPRIIARFGQEDAYAVRNPCITGQDLTPTPDHRPIKDKRLSSTYQTQHDQTSASPSTPLHSTSKTPENFTGVPQYASFDT